ncbi:MAG: hypothetical protein J6Y93_07420, partial [Treponema sp.]|nr:hypothetical protein [Treponema sp.]
PLLFPILKVGDKHYADGCLTDSVPFERALERGCDKVVVITTQEPWDGPTDFKKMKLVLTPLYRRNWPKLYQAMMNRYDNYCAMENRLRNLESNGKALVFRPSEVLCDLFENSAEKIDAAYNYGMRSASERLDEVKKFLSE